MPRRRLVAAAALAAIAGTTPVGSAAAGSLPSPECVARTTPVPSGPARLVSDKVVAGHHGRLHDLTLRSPAVGEDVEVYVLLPTGYTPDPATPYHVLYLLHGSGGSQVDWTAHGAQQLLARAGKADHLPSTITVMPDDGVEGFYTDWYGTDVDNPAEKVAPGWATFMTGELVPFIDTRYRTLATRAGRAIAGLSMGGFGATSLAARNPGMFSVVGSFSGAVNPDLDSPYEGLVLEGTSPGFTYGPPTTCIWGDPLTHRIGWEANDPTYLAANLAHTALYVATGDGLPGRYDGLTPAELPTTTVGGAVELDISEMNAAFLAALDSAHVAHTDYLYGGGTHSWPYWDRDLTRFVSFLADRWRRVDVAPRSFSDRTAMSTFSAWGWQFVAQRPVEEFTYLRDVSRSGLDIAGSGSVRVITPALYPPGSTWSVHGERVIADRRGRLTFAMALPRHAYQQISFPAGSSLPAGWHWVRIRIREITADR